MLKVAHCQPALSIILSVFAAPYTVILYVTVHELNANTFTHLVAFLCSLQMLELLELGVV